MISGSVDEQRQATISLTLRSSDSRQHATRALIDTGFNSFLCLPEALLDRLAWIHCGESETVLGDGRAVLLPVFLGAVLWEGRPKWVTALKVPGEAIVGMSLLDGHELRIDAVPGGRVTVRPLERPAGA